MNTHFFSRQQHWLVLMFGCLLVFLAASLAHGQWLDYAQRVATLDEPLSRLRWIVGDISEVAFYKHELPALGLLLGACLAHWAQVRGYRWQGFAICYGSGLWPWVFTSSLLGLLLSHALWGWTLASGIWQPTFVAFVSLPAAMVLLFGAGWRVTITGAPGQPADGQLPVLSPAVARGSGQCEWHGCGKRRGLHPVQALSFMGTPMR